MIAIVTDPLPERWKSVRLKFFTSRLYGLSQPPEYQPEGLPFVRATNVLRGKLINDGLVFVSEADLSEPRAVRLMAGDIIVVRSGAYTGDSALVTADWAGGVAGFDIVVRVNRYAHPRFVAFSLLSPSVLEQQIKPMRSRAAQPHLNAEELGDVELMLPPLDEQRAIADYLDRETARLDGLVTAKERVLELLAEKRRALITRAVTRGLDPCAPLRNSGIPWLGEIPAHWTATRMKFLATEPLAYGANEAALEDDPTFPRFVRITDVDSEGNLRDETFKSLPSEVAEPYLLRDGDVLLARSGATVGKAFIYKPAWGIACFAGYLIRCRCNTALMQPDFLFAYTQTEPYWWQVREGTIQATIQNFSAEKYGDLVVTVPPLEEQKAIIAHIAAEASKLDALRAATERTISLLKERRTALIAAAVTGKLDVQGAGRHLAVVAD